jgi:geranylgeranylglycerol-phosphate geranylgeranyltransferase
MIFIAILVGYLIAGYDFSITKIAFAFLTGLLLEASTFALNDYFDLEIDRKNKRMDRPLVRGDLKPRTALLVFSLLFPLGIFSSLMVNLYCFGIAFVTALFAVLYDIRMKKRKLLGNFYIAYIMAVPFLFGAVAASYTIPTAIWILASMAFLSGLGREIMKDIIDIKGDKEQGVKSIPMYIGEKNTCVLISLLYIIAILLSFLPFLLDTPYQGNVVYIGIILLADALFIAISIGLITNPDFKLYRKITLIAMGFGLAAFLAGISI